MPPDPATDTYPRVRRVRRSSGEHAVLLVSAQEAWRVRDVVWRRNAGTQTAGWVPAQDFTDHRGRTRVFTRSDADGTLVHPVERRATPVGDGPGEFDHDLSTLTTQLARATAWAPEDRPHG